MVVKKGVFNLEVMKPGSINKVLVSFLLSGDIELVKDQGYIRNKRSGTIYPYEQIEVSDWGFVYEKHVGQQLVREGYNVDYRGLKLGKRDKGVDLVARKANEILYIQCKYGNTKIRKDDIVRIFSQASYFLVDELEKSSSTISFMLVVDSYKNHFSMGDSELIKEEESKYPLLQYFLNHNYPKNMMIKVDAREISMSKY